MRGDGAIRTEGGHAGGASPQRPAHKSRSTPIRGGNSVSTTTPKPYEFIGFGGGGGQNPYEFIEILLTTTPEPYEFLGFRGGGTDRIPAAYLVHNYSTRSLAK